MKRQCLVARLMCITFVFSVTTTAALALPSQFVFNRADFATGNYPSGVIVADVNGDGRQDLVVVNESDSDVSVLLGRPNGIFRSQRVFATAAWPFAVITADFNHDGNLDLAVASLANSVSILLGNGDGTFQNHLDYPAGTGSLRVKVGDFNRDGNMDLVVLSSTISVLMGIGDGTFSAKADYTVGLSPTDVAIGDLDGDGNLDLVVANSGETSLSVLMGKSDGTFSSRSSVATESGPEAIAIGDFDGDTKLDLAVTHQNAPWNLTILKGKGDGTFQAEADVATDEVTYGLETGDVNGDGKADLVLTLVFAGGVVVHLGNGNGTFQSGVAYSTTAYPSSYPEALAARDVNGDGHLDLVVIDRYANHATVLLGDGDGTFGPRRNLPTQQAIASTVGDFNGDGIPDLAVADSEASGVEMLLGAGKGVFQPPIFTNTNGAHSIVAGDFNEDGHLDIAVVNNGGFGIFLGDATGRFVSAEEITSVRSIIRAFLVGDINGDGHEDLVVLGNGFEQTKPIYVFLGNGDGSFQAGIQSWDSGNIPMMIASGDFDRDGKVDVVVAVNPNGLAVMRGNGDGTFQNPTNYGTDEFPTGVTVADINEDGIPDILATGLVLDVFRGNGDGTFAKRIDLPAGNFPWYTATGDFNGDGRTDIAVSALGGGANGAIEILLGKGSGRFTTPIEVASPGAYIAPMLATDLNQDGTTDLVAPGAPGSIFLSAPIATLSPVSLDFGAVKIGRTSAVKTIKLANSGNAPLEFVSISASNGYSVTGDCGVSLGARSICSLKVTFTPSAPGNDTGVLSIVDNAPGGEQHMRLSGQGK